MNQTIVCCHKFAGTKIWIRSIKDVLNWVCSHSADASIHDLHYTYYRVISLQILFILLHKLTYYHSVAPHISSTVQHACNSSSGLISFWACSHQKRMRWDISQHVSVCTSQAPHPGIRALYGPGLCFRVQHSGPAGHRPQRKCEEPTSCQKHPTPVHWKYIHKYVHMITRPLCNILYGLNKSSK